MATSPSKGPDKLLPFYLSRWKTGICICLLMAISFNSRAQCPTNQQVFRKLETIDQAPLLSPKEKLTALLAEQKSFEACHLPEDSVYALLLNRIGVKQFSQQKINEAIKITLASIKINTSKSPGANRRMSVTSFYNLGYYFASIYRFTEALKYLDQCIEQGNAFKDANVVLDVVNARYKKAHIFYQTGDFERAIEESALGIHSAGSAGNPASMIDLLNVQAESYASLHKVKEALNAANKASALIPAGNLRSLADNCKTKAMISEVSGNQKEAFLLYSKAIELRTKEKDTAGLASDYLDAGNTLRQIAIDEGRNDFVKASGFYSTSFRLAQISGNTVAGLKATNNTAAINFRLKNYEEAAKGYHNSLRQLFDGFTSTDIFTNPPYAECALASDKNFLSLVLANKAECLLHLYRQSRYPRYLVAAMSTSLLTDSLITDMRHEQTR